MRKHLLLKIDTPKWMRMVISSWLRISKCFSLLEFWNEVCCYLHLGFGIRHGIPCIPVLAALVIDFIPLGVKARERILSNHNNKIIIILVTTKSYTI
jgi:hypothetical protein